MLERTLEAKQQETRGDDKPRITLYRKDDSPPSSYVLIVGDALYRVHKYMSTRSAGDVLFVADGQPSTLPWFEQRKEE